jgi:hypothetical protein
VAGGSWAGGPAGDPGGGPEASRQRPAAAMQPSWLTRRAVIASSAAVAGVLLASCRGVQVLGTPPPLPADVRTLQTAIAAEQTLIAGYQSAISQARAVDPAVLAGLSDVAAEHQQHLAQLKAQLVVPAGASHATRSAGAAPHPAGDLHATIGVLEEAESAAAHRLASQLLTVPPSLAQLMASISASETTHVGVLAALRRRVT